MLPALLLCGLHGCAREPGAAGSGFRADLGHTAPYKDLSHLQPDASPPALTQPVPCLGYILYSTPTPKEETPVTELMDMQGQVVRTWPYSGFPSVMLPGGSILTNRSLRDDININLLQDAVDMLQVSWESQISWSFSSWDNDQTGSSMSRQHHDLQRAGNPVGYYAPGQTAALSGVTTVLAHLTRTVRTVSEHPLTDDVIYQVTPEGKIGNFVWRAADHVEEFGFDASARQDLRRELHYNDERGTVDWLHLNSMALLGRNPWYEKFGDVHFAPDNIIVGSRAASFLAIISGKTGAVVWRLGPELPTSQPGAEVGQLVGPHHAHMIPHGLPGAGNILVFDNGGYSGYGGADGYPRHERWYSRVVEIDPRAMKKVWEYGPKVGVEKLFSPALGSAQRLPSGNTFISSGAEGRLLEVTQTGAVVWKLQLTEHRKPVSIYRAYRVPPEWLPAKANVMGYPAWSQACRGP